MATVDPASAADPGSTGDPARATVRRRLTADATPARTAVGRVPRDRGPTQQLSKPVK
jgi:hypothetical protein